MARTVIAACALAAVVAAVSTGCGASAKASGTHAQTQKVINLYEIDQIERSWHKAASTHNVNLMMSLWAPGATFNIGTDTYTGKAQIRKFFETKNKAFQPGNHWESDTPSYEIRVNLAGNKATLYFECHYIDVKTGNLVSVVGVDHNLQKIHGRWLIVDGSGSTATLG